MQFSHISAVLTDIEGTTSSVNFVYEVLFPYFRSNMDRLKGMTHDPEVQKAFKRTVELARELEGLTIRSVDEILSTLRRWSEEDRKIPPLKTLQGILWQEGYVKGELKGHVYDDVAPALKKWVDSGLKLAVFSSGSVTAQKLIFGHSISGDLTTHFTSYFDTETGGKRDPGTYEEIAHLLQLKPQMILFLSDIKEELEAANSAGMQSVQLVRSGTNPNWEKTVNDFSEIEILP
jgi:enolase-phosphatase E1